MTLAMRVLSGAVFAVLCVASAVAAHTLLPAPSTWTLNATKSDFGGVPGMKSDVWRVLIASEKRFKYTDVMVLDSGKTVRDSWDGPQDGTMKPSPGMPGATMGYKLADDTAHMAMPDGSTMDSVIVLAPDGKVLTLKMDIRAKDGTVAHQTLVYERTK